MSMHRLMFGCVFAAATVTAGSACLRASAQDPALAKPLIQGAQQARAKAFNQIANWSANQDGKPSDIFTEAGKGVMVHGLEEGMKAKYGIPHADIAVDAIGNASSQWDAYQKAGAGGLFLDLISNFGADYVGGLAAIVTTAAALETGPAAPFIGAAA
jgi:hypothetical protein